MLTCSSCVSGIGTLVSFDFQFQLKRMMKLSLKFQGENENQNQQHSTQIMKAKVPITILNKPFLSGVTATAADSPSDFSFSLSTNFPSAPSLRLSYSPTASVPFSLSLKSGLGLLGSPAHSPLVFSANFSLSPTHPSFFLHFKPQFGHFSLRKTVFSDTNTQSLSNPLPPPPEILIHGSSTTGWHNLKLEPSANTDQSDNTTYFDNFKNDAKNALFPGVRVMARTVMPVTKGFLLSFRWGVNFPRNFGSKMPSLTVNKIGLERVEEWKETNNDKKQRMDGSEIDLQLLKGMCFWMGRDLEIVEKENREMKRLLDEMKLGRTNLREQSNGGGRKLSESNGEVQRWRSYKSERQEEEKKVQQPNKPQSVATTDVESELEKAIKAATSTS